MQRIKETFLQRLTQIIPLREKSVLEIGCGDGARSVEIAQHCSHLTAVDPCEDQLSAARMRLIPNADFVQGNAQSLNLPANSFDVVIFTLSFHHVPVPLMDAAIDEAVRVVRRGGNIVFLEPDEQGSFFEAEIQFDACDGDEREAKRAAYDAMKGHPDLLLVSEFADETIFHFESLDDFAVSMSPKANLDLLKSFLQVHAFTLSAMRRINVYTTS